MALASTVDAHNDRAGEAPLGSYFTSASLSPSNASPRPAFQGLSPITEQHDLAPMVEQAPSVQSGSGSAMTAMSFTKEIKESNWELRQFVTDLFEKQTEHMLLHQANRTAHTILEPKDPSGGSTMPSMSFTKEIKESNLELQQFMTDLIEKQTEQLQSLFVCVPLVRRAESDQGARDTPHGSGLLSRTTPPRIITDIDGDDGRLPSLISNLLEKQTQKLQSLMVPVPLDQRANVTSPGGFPAREKPVVADIEGIDGINLTLHSNPAAGQSSASFSFSAKAPTTPLSTSQVRANSQQISQANSQQISQKSILEGEFDAINEQDLANLQLKGIVQGVHNESSWYARSLQKRVAEIDRSVFHIWFEQRGLGSFLPRHPPKSHLSSVVRSQRFRSLCMSMVVLHAIFMGYMTHEGTRLAFSTGEPLPDNYLWIDMVFNFFFIMELLLRIVALRTWFFVSPSDLRWNYLDLGLVSTSILADVTKGVDFKFFRLLRAFRLLRLVKMLRASRVFVQMRKMMLSIMASFISLAWALVFLGAMIFTFSVFLLDGVRSHLAYHDYDDKVRTQFALWYSSLPRVMFGLLYAITGGDWVDIMEPLRDMAFVYPTVFVFYVVYVIIGVLNILTGIFVESATSYNDRYLTVRAEIERLDSFVEEMIDLFQEFCPNVDDNVSWEDFDKYLHAERVQAYLSSHMLETTHARMLFRLLDYNDNGTIGVYEFVLGMLKLKGGAKSYDNHVLLNEICELKKITMEMTSDMHRLHAVINGRPKFLR